jgi:WD40 repeat protein/Mg-chelatase subunit ChlD
MDTLKNGIFMPLFLGLIVFLFPFSGVGADAPQILKGHSSRVTSVVYSPDGNTLASGSRDNTVKLWDAETGELKHTLTGHSNDVNAIAFSPDGKTLASASYDKTIKLWNVQTGELEHTLTGHSSLVMLIAYSPDGKTLASASSFLSNDKTIKLWNVKTGELKHTFTGHFYGINAIAYSPDGKTLASANDQTVKLWDVKTGELKQTLTGHSNWVRDVAYLPDGKILVSVSDDKTIKLWDAKTGELKNTLTDYSNGNVAYPADGKFLAFASDDGSIKLWNTKTGEIIHSLVGHKYSVNALVYSPTESILTSVDGDKIKLWNTKTGKWIVNLQYASGVRVNVIAYSADGQTLVSASGNEVQIWDVSVKKREQLMSSVNPTIKLLEDSAVVTAFFGWNDNDLSWNDYQRSPSDDDNITDDDGNMYTTTVPDNDTSEHKDTDDVPTMEALKPDTDVDIVSVIDVTGSMQEEMNEVLNKVHKRLLSRGFITFRDNMKAQTFSDEQDALWESKIKLPHNGLFVRRNNAFGTKQNTSLKELIAQGMMIEQDKIRFDDFVALNTEGIPSPKSNNALAVSHGIATIPAHQKRDERKKATHYLEIALKTADIAPVGHIETKAPPVNYIFVVDVSGSMSGEKIDTVKAAIRELFTRLRADDVIGVVAFNHQAKTLLESTPKQNISPSDFGKVINNLNADGFTDINLALSISIDEMRRYRGAQRVNQLFLFSDGNPTSGETDWINIRQNIATKMRQNTATDGNIRLSTFVFGTDANKVELDRLAGITGGQSTFVIEPKEDVRHSLQQELARRNHLAAINVQMQIEIDSKIDILHFYGHDLITNPATRASIEREADLTGKKVEEDYGVKPQPDLIKEDKGIRVFVPNLAVGETYWVVFELAVPEQHKLLDFGKATVQYFDTFARQNQKPQFDLSPEGQIAPQWVAQHALGLWTSEVASYALYDVEANDLKTAEKRIQNHISVLETARTHLTPQMPTATLAPVKLVDDIITLTKFLSLAKNLNQGASADNARVYLNYGLSELDSVRNGFVRRVNYGRE